MTRISLISAVVAGAVAAAIGLAPAAAADEIDELEKGDSARGSSQRATAADRDGMPRSGSVRKPSQPGADKAVPGWTNEALWARDGASGPNNFGTLPKPPVYALD